MSSSFSRFTSSPGLYSNNYSFYAVPAAWVLAFAPHVYAMALYNKERAPGTTEWDARYPKKNIDNVKEGKLSPAMQDRFIRAEAANDNMFVGLPLFAAAIVAGNMARLPSKTLNSCAGAYLALRLIYTYLYVNGTTKTMANARAGTWLGASMACLTLFVKAGNKFREGLNLAL